MQNAVDHAFPDDDDGPVLGTVRVPLRRESDELLVDVVDDGVGLPEDFALDRAKGLGLSIVQALVTGELGGTIEMSERQRHTRPRADPARDHGRDPGGRAAS